MDVSLVTRLQHRIKVLEKEKKLLQIEAQNPDNLGEKMIMDGDGEKEIYETIKVREEYH